MSPKITDRRLSVVEFGAIGDGNKDNSAQINRAIQVCAQEGGGQVVIPAGVWRTGPIRLRSGIQLHVENGAVVLFSQKFEDYPLMRSNFEGEDMVRCQSPLHGEGLDDIAITGSGIFDGGGGAWRPVKRIKTTQRQWRALIASGGVVSEDGAVWWPTENAMRGAEFLRKLAAEGTFDLEAFEPIRTFLRPSLLSLRNCRRILLDGPTFQNSAAWCLHPWACKDITIRNVTVRNPWYAQNGDGLDVDSCRDVLIEDSSFDVGDDAICIKSGKNERGRNRNMPSECIAVRRCTVYHGHGGFVIGSEMSGGVRKVHVSDCTFIGTDIGLRVKSQRGRGGVVEDVVVERIRMSEIKHEAISLDLFYDTPHTENVDESEETGVPDATTPLFRDIHVRDIICVGARTAVLMRGLPEQPIQDLDVERIHVHSDQGMVLRNLTNVRLDGVFLHSASEPTILLDQARNVTFAATKLDSKAPSLMVVGERTRKVDCANVTGIQEASEVRIEIGLNVSKDEIQCKMQLDI